MPLLLADLIYSRDCKLNLRKNVDTTSLDCIVRTSDKILKAFEPSENNSGRETSAA